MRCSRCRHQTNLKERLQGYQSAFAEHPGIKITDIVDMNGNSDVAFDNAKRLINSKAKVDAFVCLEALSCPAVADVVNRANMGGKVTIVAMDTDPGTLDWIKKGVISATIAQKPFTMAYFGAKVLGDLHLHPPNPLSGNWSQNSFSADSDVRRYGHICGRQRKRRPVWRTRRRPRRGDSLRFVRASRGFGTPILPNELSFGVLFGEGGSGIERILRNEARVWRTIRGALRNEARFEITGALFLEL